MGYQPSNGTTTAQPIGGVDDLLAYFRSGFKKTEEERIGMEVESHGIHKSNYQPVTYLEQNGIRKIQEKLIEELNWQIERQEEKFITSMGRGGSHLTLEYSESMSELSGRINPSIHDLARELRIHQHEISEMSRLYDVVWLGIGYQPFTLPEYRRVKIKRFDMLENFFRRRSKTWGEHWHRVASVQANIDYNSDEDVRRKFQILLRLGPFLSAMYAHSPLKDGKNTGFVSYRTHILRQIDPRRFGIRKAFFSPHFNLQTWIKFCMSVPMIGIYREGKWISVKRMTFKQFMKTGYEGHMPVLDDWILHLSFIYTDVRIKTYIELRSCDSLPPFFIPSMQAIVKGFVYHPDGEKLIKDLTKGWSFREFATVYSNIARFGMQTECGGKMLLDYCKEILNIATANLRSIGNKNEKDEDESVHLQPIKEFVFVKEKSLGRWVMENWDGEWRQNPEKLIEWCSFEGGITG